MRPSHRVYVDATGAVFDVGTTARIRGVQLVSGTSVTFYEGGDATGDPVVVAVSAGTVQDIPGGIDCDGVWAVVAGSGIAILYYE